MSGADSPFVGVSTGTTAVAEPVSAHAQSPAPWQLRTILLFVIAFGLGIAFIAYDFKQPFSSPVLVLAYAVSLYSLRQHIPLTSEVSGEARKDKANKVATAKTLWVPAINNDGGFGRWVFVEVDDVEAAKLSIRAAVGAVLEHAL